MGAGPAAATAIYSISNTYSYYQCVDMLDFLWSIGAMTNEPPRFATPHDALREAIRRIGSQQKTARVCDVSPVSVWRWVRDAKSAPQRFVMLLSRASGVAPSELRPDLHWPEEAEAVAVMAPAHPAAAALSAVPSATYVRPVPTNDNCCCGCCHRLPPSAA